MVSAVEVDGGGEVADGLLIAALLEGGVALGLERVRHARRVAALQPPKLRTEHAEVSKGGPLTRWQGFASGRTRSHFFSQRARTQVFRMG